MREFAENQGAEDTEEDATTSAESIAGNGPDEPAETQQPSGQESVSDEQAVDAQDNAPPEESDVSLGQGDPAEEPEDAPENAIDEPSDEDQDQAEEHPAPDQQDDEQDATSEGPAAGSENLEQDEETHQAESATAESADEEPPATPDPSEAEIDATVEAVLFATNTPLSPPKIAQVAEIPGGRRVIKESVARLNDVYEQSGRVFRIESIAGGYRFHTLPQYHDVLARLTKVKSDSKLSQAAMETLAIVAYRQPIIRADVEAIRGVACGEMLRSLMEKNLVKITGRAEVLGRPMLYGTTNHFLEVFGLNSLDDLPQGEELRTPPEPKEDNPEEPEPQDDQEEAPKAEPAEQREESSETENAADAQTTPYNEQTDADAEDQAADSEAEPEDRIE